MSELEKTVAFSDIQVTAYAQPYGGEEFELEVSSVSLRFTENGIPKAVLQITLGESPQPGGGTRVAEAHARAMELERRDHIRVVAKFKGHQAPSTTWEYDGQFNLFFGYLSRPAYTMGVGAASLVLEVDHWLSDLATTHKLSYISAPSSADHWTRPVVVTSFTGAGVGFDGRLPLFYPDADKHVWKAIKELFTFMASTDRLEAKVIRDLGITSVDLVQNTLALQALSFMDTGKTVPLAFKSTLSGLHDRICSGLMTTVAARDTGSSYWETLLSLSREFMFSVIPTIYTATCAPVVKTLNSSWRTIEASEYDQIRVALGGAERSLPVRALGLYSGLMSFALDTRGLSQPQYGSDQILIGYWDIAKDQPNNAEIRAGQLVMLTAPGWTCDAGSSFSPATPQNTPRYEAIRTAANCKSGGTPPNGQSPNEQERTVVDPNDPNRPGNQLARVMLSDIVWKDRQGSISGRLRFDIAPGSAIKLGIVGKNVPFYRKAGAAKYLYAHVYQVDIDIDATIPRASTTLQLSHMRTEQEQNEYTSIVIDSHPLYEDVWKGTTLLDGHS